MVVLVAILGATAAAWWPARAAAHVPVTLALSGRPPKPRPARHSAVAAAALIMIGVGCLALSDRDRPPLSSPESWRRSSARCSWARLTIRVFARAAAYAPGRPAPGDSGPRPLPGAVRGGTCRHHHRPRHRLQPSWSPRQLRTGAGRPSRRRSPRSVRSPDSRVHGIDPDPQLIPFPMQSPVALAQTAARVRRLAAALGEAAVIPLRKAFRAGQPPIVTFEGDRALVAVGLARQTAPKEGSRGSGLYVATPALLTHLGVDPATVDASSDFLADATVPIDELVILDFRARKHVPVTNVQRIVSREVLGAGEGNTGSVPSSFVTVDGLRRRGWQQVPSGWLVESAAPPDERHDRRCARLRGRRRPHDRDAASERLRRDAHRHRDRSGSPTGARRSSP